MLQACPLINTIEMYSCSIIHPLVRVINFDTMCILRQHRNSGYATTMYFGLQLQERLGFLIIRAGMIFFVKL